MHTAVGPNGTIFTSEKSTPRIQAFTNDGESLCSFGEGKFSGGCGYLDIAVDLSGNVYVVDDSTCSVLIFSVR